ncbi:MAG: hypothetical protein VB106_21270 [Clostridiaceae bacterium]|jgi:hypothetical protein|nr:hypothetical protein [Clostridiaceae bacterium]
MGNYNLKNIMLGVGIGLVFSSMINISMGSKELTLEDIKKEALKHDLIVLSKEDIIISQSQENTAPAAPAPAAADSLTLDKEITINIESGMSSEDVTGLLNEKGLIKDKAAFLKRLGELGMEKKLKVGSFKISIGSDYDQIIKILAD